MKILLSIILFISLSHSGYTSEFSVLSPQVKREIISSQIDRELLNSANIIIKIKPSALQNVHLEGSIIQNSQYKKIKNATYDWDKMKVLAYAWHVTRSKEYLNTLSIYMAAWLDIYKVTYNPIDEEKITNMIIAYDLVKDDLTVTLNQKMRDFLQHLLFGYMVKIKENSGKDFTNWQSHRLKIATFCAFSLGDIKSVKLIENYYYAQLNNNLLPNGHVYDYEIHDSYSYALYDLNSLLLIALVAKRHGYNWFYYTTENGASLTKSLNWVNFITQEPTGEQFANSKIKFDSIRRVAGVKGMQSQWDPMQAQKTFAISSMIDSKYDEFVEKKIGKPKLYLLLF